MKKTVFYTLLLGCFLFTAPVLHAQWLDKATLYVPNRILDLMDMFTVNIGCGPTAHAELYATQNFKIGGGIFHSFKLIKDFNRQYGYARMNGGGCYIPMLMTEDIECRPTSSLVKEYWQNCDGVVPSPNDSICNPEDGARDFWAIGGSLGAAVIDGEVSIHPIEILDAVLGFFFIDIRNDDLTFENFR